MWKKRLIFIISILCLFVVGCKEEKEKEINISVASSLKEPIDELCNEYEKENNIEININYGSSGTLKNQIQEGAPVSLFISANKKYVDELSNEGMCTPGDINNFLGNSLVVIGNKDEAIFSLESFKYTKGKISLGEEGTVPAGQYGKEALVKAKVFDELKGRIVYGNNVTTVKNYVEGQNVTYGIVYKTDSLNLKNSKVLYEIPSNMHSEIIYSMCTLTSGNKDEGLKLAYYFTSQKGKDVFLKYGFKVNK